MEVHVSDRRDFNTFPCQIDARVLYTGVNNTPIYDSVDKQTAQIVLVGCLTKEKVCFT